MDEDFNTRQVLVAFGILIVLVLLAISVNLYNTMYKDNIPEIADYIEERLNNSQYGYNGQILNDMTSLGEIKVLYFRYDFVSRNLLENEIETICSKCYRCDKAEEVPLMNLSYEELELIKEYRDENLLVR